MTTGAPLPYIDEHSTTVAAGADAVWQALVASVDGAFGGSGAVRYARLVGCEPAARSGPRPLVTGATVPGFRVVRAEPGSVLALEGRHRFSSYALTFHVEPNGDGRSRLRAESRAAFPGAPGRAYRLLVIGSRVHGLLVRRFLDGVRRRAEAV
jgi:hypothetical protein